MNMKRKPIVGEILYDLNIGNAARRGENQFLTPVEVKSVGRKYFTCSPTDGVYRPETTYHVENWRQKTEYCQDHQLYETRQEWEDEKEVSRIHAMLRAKFSSYGQCGVKLNTLQAIERLLLEDES
jgi:hypothetical protein